MSSRLNVRALAGATLVALSLLALGCRTLKPQGFATASPRFEPEKFFEGPTRSWGVMESRTGKPKSRFETVMMGVRDGKDLVITQDFTFEDGHQQQRLWRLRRIDEHRYEATANDVVGVSVGEAYGNTFHWKYTVALRPGHLLSRLANVHFELFMYLAADSETLINRVIVRKLGIILAETTEHFHRGPGPVPSIR
jgi:hypothetical protein